MHILLRNKYVLSLTYELDAKNSTTLEQWGERVRSKNSQIMSILHFFETNSLQILPRQQISNALLHHELQQIHVE